MQLLSLKPKKYRSWLYNFLLPSLQQEAKYHKDMHFMLAQIYRATNQFDNGNQMQRKRRSPKIVNDNNLIQEVKCLIKYAQSQNPRNKLFMLKKAGKLLSKAFFCGTHDLQSLTADHNNSGGIVSENEHLEGIMRRMIRKKKLHLLLEICSWNQALTQFFREYLGTHKNYGKPNDYFSLQ